MTMNESKHSPGLCALHGVNDPPNQGNMVLDIGEICGAATLHTHCEEHWPREKQVANGRLLAAAYNSYNRHCGPRAVECAEGDLLGELLEACREAEAILAEHEQYDPPEDDECSPSREHEAAQACRAAIAQATGERT